MRYKKYSHFPLLSSNTHTSKRTHRINQQTHGPYTRYPQCRADRRRGTRLHWEYHHWFQCKAWYVHVCPFLPHRALLQGTTDKPTFLGITKIINKLAPPPATV